MSKRFTIRSASRTSRRTLAIESTTLHIGPTTPLLPPEDAVEVAERAFATWQAVDAALSPILGRGGMTALYKRCLIVTASDNFEWLPSPQADMTVALEFVALRSALAEQSLAQAEGASHALLDTLFSMLSIMVGPLLTEQLLRTVWSRADAQSRSLEQ